MTSASSNTNTRTFLRSMMRSLVHQSSMVPGVPMTMWASSFSPLAPDTEQKYRLFNLSPLLPAYTAFPGSPSRRPISTSRGPPHAGLYQLQRRPPSPIFNTTLHRFSYWAHKRNVSFSSSLRLHSFEFRRVLTAARQ